MLNEEECFNNAMAYEQKAKDSLFENTREGYLKLAESWRRLAAITARAHGNHEYGSGSGPQDQQVTSDANGCTSVTGTPDSGA